MKRFLESCRAVPWWVLSGGLHAFIFAALALHAYETARAEPGCGLTIPLVYRVERMPLSPEVPAPLPAKRELSARRFPGDTITRPENVGNDAEILPGFLAMLDATKDSPGCVGSEPPPSHVIGVGGDFDKPSRRGGGIGIGFVPEGGGSPFAGRKPGNHGGGATPQTEAAMLAGLRWLARHQAEDGRWAAAGFGERCANGPRCEGIGDSDNDVGITGLALLAFLGAGYTHQSTETYVDKPTGRVIHVGRVVKSGLRWLLSTQSAEGQFVTRNFQTYNTSIATTAMCEAYGLTKAEIFRDAAQRGIDYVLQAQNPYYGWRYSKRCGDNDTSNLGFCVMALHSGQMAGLVGVEHGYDGARKWLDDVTDENYGYVGYCSKGDSGSVRFPETEAWQLHRSMTAVGAMCRVFMDGEPFHRSVPVGAAILAQDLPVWADKKIDFYYWYYGTLAEYLADSPKGQHWRAWNDAIQKALLPHQHGEKDGCLDGSWDVDVDRTAIKGAGRVYTTALNTMTLEVYYRFPRAFGVRK